MRVNLLPPEVRRERRDAGRLRTIRFVGFAALLLLGGLYGIRTVEVFMLRGNLEQIRTEKAAVEVERQQLGQVATARDAVVAGEALAAELVRGEISWSAQLLRLAQVVPGGFRLTAVSGQTSSTAVAGLVGSISFNAESSDFVPAEALLIRIAAEEGWANGWVSSIAASQAAYSVGGSFDLTSETITARGGGPA